MTLLCDDFTIDLVRGITHDGTPGEIIPRVRFFHLGRQTAEFVSYHVADTMKRYASHSGERPWRLPMQFDIRVVRVDGHRMVYSVLPEFESWLQKTAFLK